MTNTEDRIVTATGFSGSVLAYVCSTKNLVEELRRRHDLWPVVTAALGRTATVGAILGSSLKHSEHQVTIQIQGDGPIGKMLVVATGERTVRGYADEPHIELPLKANGKLDVGQAVGTDGSLSVIKDMGLREPYRGSVPLVSGELGEDFTYYFAISEQTPSAVSVGVLVDRDYSVKSAGGLILQVLPGATEQIVSDMETALQSLPSMTSMLDAGESLIDILQRIFGSDYKVLDEHPVHFACTCSKPRLAGILVSLGKDELVSLLEDQGQAELICHFCEEHYQFSGSELADLIQGVDERTVEESL